MAWDHWTTEEALKRAEGRVVEAEGAREFAKLLMRAYRSELEDPKPIIIDGGEIVRRVRPE
jgi:hypothetical protein